MISLRIDHIRESMTGQNQHFDVYNEPLRGSTEFEASHTRHLMELFDESNNNQSRRLSLSLGSSMRQGSVNPNLINPHYMLPGDDCCAPSYGGQSFPNVVGNSRYLKPAQALLEETVNVGGRDIDIGSGLRCSLGLSADLKAKLCNNQNLLANKHEIQVQVIQLLSLLEEVEGRYDKYCHQMEEVVSSFEAVAGIGAGRTYTAQALQAMSRHFCSLRDAIVSQINRKCTRQLPNGLSRLSLMDGRDNRIMCPENQRQQQEWRPIRGLPDTSVAVLRSWLMEHFLHPYPNDSEKLMLSSQTGLTKNQVSNWFINARVRLWKPMIEEIYKEEFGDSSQEPNHLCDAS